MTSRKYGRSSSGNDAEVAALEPVDRLDQRRDRSVQRQDLALERVDALSRRRGRGREDLAFELSNVVLERRDHRPVVVDDAVDDRVQRGAGPEAQEVRTGFQRQPDVVQGRFPVPDRDDEAVPDEHLDLAELDPLVGLAVPG